MMNVNCLAGMKCPKCGQEDKFQIVGSLWLDVTDDGSRPTEDKTRSDHEWTKNSGARCAECDWQGKVVDLYRN